MAREYNQEDDEKALNVERNLQELIKQWFHSDPMRAAIIEPVIHKRAIEYHQLTGTHYIYSLARER